MVNDLFKNMENEVLLLILREYPVLLNKLKQSHITKREFTGVGFYSNFESKDDIIYGDDMQISDVGGRINNSLHVGFLLFVKKGKLDFLECFTYGDPWPENIESYEIFVE